MMCVIGVSLDLFEDFDDGSGIFPGHTLIGFHPAYNGKNKGCNGQCHEAENANDEEDQDKTYQCVNQ